MSKVIIKFVLSWAIIMLAACSPQADATEIPATNVPAQAVTTFTVTGSGSVTPILSALGAKFEADNPSYALEVLAGTGTSGGVRGVIDGTLDFAAMSREPRDTEAEEGVVFKQFGTSVTAVYTHPDVGVTELTSEQLSDIFAGTITNWSEVGGEDTNIILYIRDPEEGNTVDIREEFIDDVEFAESAQLMTSQTDMQNAVSSIEGAIGYGTWATVIANDVTVTPLTIDGIGIDNTPDAMTTAMGVGYLSDRTDDLQVWLDWLESDTAQSTLQSLSIVTVE